MSGVARRHWALLLTHAALGMAFGYVLRPVTSTEILDGGHSSAWLGVATMVFAVPPLLLAIPAGRIVDRSGERSWLIGGSVAYLGATLLVLLAAGLDGDASLWVFLAASGVLGLGNLATILGQQTWVMHAAAGARPDFWFGLYTFAISIGQLAAPAVLLLPGAPAGESLATVPIAWVMVAAAIAMIATGWGVPSHAGRGRLGDVARGDGSSARARHRPSDAPETGELDLGDLGDLGSGGEGRPSGSAGARGRAGARGAADGPSASERPLPADGVEPGLHGVGAAGRSRAGREAGSTKRTASGRDGRDSAFGASARLLRRPGIVRALVASSLVLASVDVLVAYLPLLTRERGLDAAWIGGLLMARAVAAMASRLFLSRLTGAVGRRNVMVAGAALAAVSLIVAALPVPPWALIACLVAYGFAAGTVQPLTMSWMTLITPATERGHITSLRVVGNRAGQTLVPLAIAGVSVLGGGALAFGVTGATLAVSAFAATTAPDGDALRE